MCVSAPPEIVQRPRTPARPQQVYHARGGAFYPTSEAPFIVGRARIPEDYPCSVGDLLHPPHTHPGAELGVVTEGSCVFYFDGHNYSLSKGDCVFIDAMTPHAMGRASTPSVAYYYLHVSFEALLSVPPPSAGLALVRACRRQRSAALQVFSAEPKLLRPMQQAWTHFHSGTAFELVSAWAKALEMLMGLLPYSPRVNDEADANPVTTNSALTEAVTLIHERYAQPLTVAEIAEHCSMSVSQLAHVFSNAMNYSPIEYRNHIRVAKAKDKLISTSDKVAAIATEVGFEDPGQFYRLFQRLTGLTPTAFRKMRFEDR